MNSLDKRIRLVLRNSNYRFKEIRLLRKISYLRNGIRRVLVKKEFNSNNSNN
jgi:hypothetical protein